MGGKKKGKGKGKKGKKGKGGLGDDYSAEELSHIMAAQMHSLQARFIDQAQRADHAKTAEVEKRQRDNEMIKMEEDKVKDSNDIMSDMTRQYKSTTTEKGAQIA